MTVSYTGEVANVSSFGCFNKILIRWRGSVYKLIYKELLAYVSAYYIINIIYRFVLIANSECNDSNVKDCNETTVDCGDCKWYKQQRDNFEGLVAYCQSRLTSIPLTFVLGFYVNVIVTRWWAQYQLLPWPDNAAIYTMTFIEGKDERGRLMRRNIIRYVLLSYCMAIRRVSFRVKKRFPDLQHLVDAGLMREDELKVIQSMHTEVTVSKWFLPLAWAADITARALAENRIRPQTINTVVRELGLIRENLTSIINYDWVSIPLVYTQVVTIAVYSYFSAALIGCQWTLIKADNNDKFPRMDLYYPFFLTLQFVFYVGWLKVAETLINPFGEDDDDFELNRLIDRHIQVGFLIVENEETPELLKDRYWDECIPKEIPYTVAAEKFKKGEFVGSAEQTVHLTEEDKEYGYVYHAAKLDGLDHRNRHGLGTDHYDMGDYGDYESVGTPMPSNKLGWIKRKLSGMGSIGRNSISSNSTYIYGKNNNQKSFRKSQLSLYNQITRKLSLKENGFLSTHLHTGRTSRRHSRVNRTPRKRSLSETSDNHYGGIRNEGFDLEVDCVPEVTVSTSDLEPVYIQKSILDTITENQNSPYSTQVSHSVSRRMSAQSIFAQDGDRRATSVAREPTVEPVMELFHQNEEMEAKLHKLGINRSRSASLGTESSTSDKSKASNNLESGVESMAGEVIPDDEEVTGVVAGGINIDTDIDFEADCEGSPSPQLPRRAAVMSMRKIEDSSPAGPRPVSNTGPRPVSNIDSPFESFPSVYV